MKHFQRRVGSDIKISTFYGSCHSINEENEDNIHEQHRKEPIVTINNTTLLKESDKLDICSVCRQKHLVLKEVRMSETKFSDLIVTCSGFPNCKILYKLPRLIKHVIRTDQVCQSCSEMYGHDIHKIKLVFDEAHVKGKLSEYLPLENNTSGIFCHMYNFKTR